MASFRDQAAEWQRLTEQAEEVAEPLERAADDTDTRYVTWDQLASDPEKVRRQHDREQRRHERAQARADLERAKQRVAILDAAEQER